MKKLVILFSVLVSVSAIAIEVEHDLSFERDAWLKYSTKKKDLGFIPSGVNITDITTKWSVPYKVKVGSEQEVQKHLIAVGSRQNNTALLFSDQCDYSKDTFNDERCFLTYEDRAELEHYSFRYGNPWIYRGNNINIRHPYSYLFAGRGINREVKVSTRTGKNTVDVDILDFLPADKVIQNKFFKFQNDTINGSVKFKFPEQQLVSFFKQDNGENLFRTSVENNDPSIDLESSNFKYETNKNVPYGNWMTFWTLPGAGSKYIEYVFQDKTVAIKNDEWVSIGAISYETRKATDSQDLDLVKFATQDASQVASENLMDSGQIINLRDQLITLINNKNNIEQLVSSLSLDELQSFLSNLNTILLKNYLEPEDSEGFSFVGWDIKTAAQVLSIELAMKSLSSLEVYCKEVDFTTSEGEQAKVSGLLLASFYVSRALTRLDSFKFKEFSFLFEFMNNKKEEGVTYAELRADADSMTRLDDVVNILRDSGVLKKSPFGIAKDELSYLQTVFGDLNGKGVKLSEVVATLSSFEKEADEIRVETMKKLRSLQPDNGDVVDFSELSIKASDLENKIEELSSNTKQLFNIQFSSASSSPDSTSSRKDFIRFILDVVTNHLSVFTNISGDTTIDRYLTAYKSHHKVDKTIETFKGCLPGY